MKNKQQEYEPLGETITLEPEIIELIQELEKSPHNLRLQADIADAVLKAWSEKSS